MRARPGFVTEFGVDATIALVLKVKADAFLLRTAVHVGAAHLTKSISFV